MKKIILTKGLPASGKTTWAKKLIADNRGLYKRVNKDELRAMLDAGRWSRDNEEMVLQIRDQIIIESLNRDKNVIVDDTNLHSKHNDKIKQLVKGKAVVEIKDFTDVSIDECIKRDLKRANSVGSKVIRNMYDQFLKPEPEERKLDPLVFEKSLPSCFCTDLDGTLAHIVDRNPYDGKSCASDQLNISVKKVLDQMQKKYHIIILSGRNGDSRQETEKWLEDNGVFYAELHMRKEGDKRKDTVVKEEMFNLYLKNKYNIVGMIDDRKQVKKMWVDLGITVFDVNQNDIDF